MRIKTHEIKYKITFNQVFPIGSVVLNLITMENRNMNQVLKKIK
ncbi:hypothetical protein [Tissierella sp.]|nr:hypothetical protein [Tissierella sp.]